MEAGENFSEVKLKGKGSSSLNIHFTILGKRAFICLRKIIILSSPRGHIFPRIRKQWFLPNFLEILSDKPSLTALFFPMFKIFIKHLSTAGSATKSEENKKINKT